MGGDPFGEAPQSNKQAVADKLLHVTPASSAALSISWAGGRTECSLSDKEGSWEQELGSREGWTAAELCKRKSKVLPTVFVI